MCINNNNKYNLDMLPVLISFLFVGALPEKKKKKKKKKND